MWLLTINIFLNRQFFYFCRVMLLRKINTLHNNNERDKTEKNKKADF
jgi:hypothetical protein